MSDWALHFFSIKNSCQSVSYHLLFSLAFFFKKWKKISWIVTKTYHQHHQHHQVLNKHFFYKGISTLIRRQSLYQKQSQNCLIQIFCQKKRSLSNICPPLTHLTFTTWADRKLGISISISISTSISFSNWVLQVDYIFLGFYKFLGAN